jgi:hypothetical protein
LASDIAPKIAPRLRKPEDVNLVGVELRSHHSFAFPSAASIAARPMR